MLNLQPSSAIGATIAKALLIVFQLSLSYLYFSVLTFIVLCFIVFSSIILTTASDLFPSQGTKDYGIIAFESIFELLNSLDSIKIKSGGSLDEQDIRAFVVQSFMLIAIVGSIVDVIRKIFFKKQRTDKIKDNKKFYLFTSGVLASLAALSAICILVDRNIQDQSLFLIIIVMFLFLSYGALYILRLLNGLMDSLDLMSKLIEPVTVVNLRKRVSYKGSRSM